MTDTKVKFLLLALALGLAQADDELSGDWRTVAIAADHPEKISEGGPLRLYFRDLQCSPGCEKLTGTFYVHVNGRCQKVSTETKHTGNGIDRVQRESKSLAVTVWQPGTCSHGG